MGGDATCPSCGAELPRAQPAAASRFEPLSLDYEEPSYNSRDLPAARENIPRPPPGAPARGARAPLELPDDLVASSEAPPPLDDLLFGPDADAAPAQPDADGGLNLGLDLMGSMDFSAPPPAAAAPARQPPARGGPVHSPDRPASNAPMQGLDIFLGELPTAGGSPLAPLDFGSPSDSLGDLPPPGDDLLLGGVPDAPADPAADGPVDIGSMLDSMLSGAQPPAAAPPVSAPSPARRPPPAARPPAAAPAARAEDVASGESGFALTLEGGAAAEPETSRAPALIPPTSSSGEGGRAGEALPGGVQWMAAPRRRADERADKVAPRSTRKLVMIGGATAAVALLIAAFFTLGPGLGGKSADSALAAFATDLGKDHFPAYEGAAEAMMAAAEDDVAARARAAELLLLAVLGRGAERSKAVRAEEILTKVPAAGDLAPEASRARALLAVVRGRGGEVEGILGAQASTPEGQLVVGLRRLRERKTAQALPALKAAAAPPGRLLPVYLLARAQEDAGKLDEARAGYRKVLAGNPAHPGALVGTARLEAQKPAARLVAAQALLTKITPAAAPPELGEARTLAGEALLALGRSAEAVTMLTRAAADSPQSTPVQVALAEALVADGRAADAVTGLRAADPIMFTSVAGRLAMGAALVASGKVAEGNAQLASLSTEAAANPRLPYWLGVAAENRKPADDAAAEASYRQALALDGTYLPASLRLAALLQRKGKADAAIALIKEAERAGAPPEALELAWGQALVEAKNPTEAIAVFRKAVARSPKGAPAHIGLANALEASGKPDEAEVELHRAITELKGAGGLRERLADLLLRQGKKEPALAQLAAEAAANPTNRAVRVRLAKLALELGHAARAQKEAEAVVAEDPATPEALFTLGRAKEALGDSGGALSDYKRATAMGTSTDLHLAYGRALSARGRDDDAIEQLTAAGDRAIARLELGRIHLRRGELADALLDAEAAVRLDPGSAAAHFLRGQCLDLLGRAEEAAVAWKAAVKVDPGLAEAHYRLGRHEMDKGRQAAALTHFRQAAALDPQKVPWLADLLFQLGIAEAQSGSKGNAATALKRYLEVAPTDAPTRPEAERELARIARR